MDDLVSPSAGLDDAIASGSQQIGLRDVAAAASNELVRNGSVNSMARPLSPKEFDETYDIPHIGLLPNEPMDE